MGRLFTCLRGEVCRNWWRDHPQWTRVLVLPPDPLMRPTRPNHRASRSGPSGRAQDRRLRHQKREGMESRRHWKVNLHRRDWLTRCEAIAGSDAFVRSGHCEDQVLLLKATLLRAAVLGEKWREIYRSIYDQWHARRPHFPDLNTMAAEIDHSRSRSNGT